MHSPKIQIFVINCDFTINFSIFFMSVLIGWRFSSPAPAGKNEVSLYWNFISQTFIGNGNFVKNSCKLNI